MYVYINAQRKYYISRNEIHTRIYTIINTIFMMCISTRCKFMKWRHLNYIAIKQDRSFFIESKKLIPYKVV